MNHLTPEEADRFRSKYVVGPGQCWLWQGKLDRDGYGSFWLRGANRRANRVGWFSMHGEIPADHVVNHTCRNRSCVNPSHLNCITASENALRDSTSAGYVNSQKTHCPEGHPYDTTERNERRGTEWRVCSICRKRKRAEAKRKRYAQAREQFSV